MENLDSRLLRDQDEENGAAINTAGQWDSFGGLVVVREK